MNTLAEIPVGPLGQSPSPEDQHKRAMRRDLRGILAGRSPADVRTQSEALCAKLAKSAYLACARCVMLYVPMPTEVDVGPLIERCLTAGVRVCVPRVDWASGAMDPAVISTWPEGLVKTRHGVMQPPDSATVVDLDSIDLVVVPGLGFDRLGARLGRGGGFYDRFLARPGLAALRVGVAFDDQIVEAIPVRREVPVSGLVAGVGAGGRFETAVPDARVHAVFTDRRILLGTDPHGPAVARATETTG